MLKRLFPFFLISLLLIIVGCDLMDSVSNEAENEYLYFYGLSESTCSTYVGEEKIVTLSFASSKPLTNKELMVSVANSSEVNSTEFFDVTVVEFSETSSSTSSNTVNFTISANSNCLAGKYTVFVDLMFGATTLTQDFELTIKNPEEDILIADIADVVLKPGETKTVYATVSTGKSIYKNDLFVHTMGTGNSTAKPLIKIASCSNNTVAIDINSENCVAGTYKGSLSVLGNTKEFLIIVQPTNEIKLEGLDGIVVKSGDTDTLSISVQNGEQLSVSDFTLELVGSNALAPAKGKIISYANGVLTLEIDAIGSTPGTNNATIKVQGFINTFIITIGERETLSISVLDDDISLYPGNKHSFKTKIVTTSDIDQCQLTYKVLVPDKSNNSTDGIRLVVDSLSLVDSTAFCALFAEETCPSDLYTVWVYGRIGDLVDSAKIRVVVTDGGGPLAIKSIENPTLEEGQITTMKAVIANGNHLTAADLSVEVAGLFTDPPVVSIQEFEYGELTIRIDASETLAGPYFGALTVDTLTKEFLIVVEEPATPLTAKIVKLYNPYAKDGYSSALNIVTGDPVAGEVDPVSGRIEYAIEDLLSIDIAVDNSADIRTTEVVAELTSINGGRFVNITRAEYDAASTDKAVKALAETKTFTDNEVILTVDDNIAVDGFFVMKLANNRGYAVVQMVELNTTDTEGSTENTGYLIINYKHTAA